MAKYGKWVGLGLGWALGGPIGGLLGLVFGSMYDGMQGGVFEYQGAQGHPYGAPAGTTKTRPGDFAASLIVLSAAIMKADGKVLKSELDYVKQFFVRQFGEQLAKENMLVLRELLKQNINVQEIAQQIRLYMDSASKLQLLHFLFGISSADGHVHTSEVDEIRRISNFLGIRSAEFESIKAMFYKDVYSAYKILETTPDANEDELKKAYRKMATKYHPDKVSHLGEEFQKAAKEKFQEVQAAYEQIKKERGMK
ncbi:MAG: TerB family tellurite resistance protein [Bacteroidales bacterium]|nr:TerB family tellurite resistance protein [Bacteroidales bacterium]